MDMKMCHADLCQGRVYVPIAVSVVRILRLAGVPPRIASAAERYLPQDHILWESHMHRLLKHMLRI